MATVLRNTGVPVVETTFEDWTVEHGAFDLVYAAQAWHWVDGTIGYPMVAAALRSGGTVALFWNQPEEWDGDLGRDIDAVYADARARRSCGHPSSGTSTPPSSSSKRETTSRQ